MNKPLIVSEKPLIRLHNSDCMPALEAMEENQYDLAIVDPPYGIGDFNNQGDRYDTRNGKIYKGPKDKYKKVDWNNSTPEREYFKLLQFVANNHIIFGFQYYIKYLWDDLAGVIVHDFKDNSFNMSHADCAITSLQRRTTVFKYLWSGFKREYSEPTDSNRIHPCEKPVALYKWLLKNYAKEGDTILDTHGGSMSIAIACYDLGFDLDLWELDEDYFKAGVDRVQKHIAQGQLFNPAQREPGKQLEI